MSRVNGGSPRNVYLEDTQTNQSASNIERARTPVLRSQEKKTGRDDDSDGPVSNADAKIQHSEPRLKSRVIPNQLPFELEPIDCERFVYTKAQFYQALVDENTKDLVRMMRVGRCDKDWSEPEVQRVVNDLIGYGKAKLLAELVRESEKFQAVFSHLVNGKYFCQYHETVSAFIKTMNDHRELPVHLRKEVLADWLQAAAEQKDIKKIKAAVETESDLLANKGHRGYHFALMSVFQDSISRENIDICVYLLENMIIEKSKVKPDLDISTCRVAARVAAYAQRNDLVLTFQDEVLSRLEADTEPLIGLMLGYDIEHRWDEVIPIFETYLRMLDGDNASSSDADEVDLEFIHQLNEQKVFGFMVDECIRPALAQAMVNLSWKCMSIFNMNESDKANRELHDVVLASQLESLVIIDKDDDPVTSMQASLLKNVGANFIRQKIGSVDSLLVECFEFVESDFTLEASRIADHLVTKFIFPKSLAEFIAQSMRETVDKYAALPMPVVPPGTSFRDGAKLLRQMVKTNACEDFTKNFGEILKRQQLITLFNAESAGREEVWTNYFYAYLDVLKGAQSSPKTEH